MSRLSYADQLYIMNTAKLECCIAENISYDDIYIKYREIQQEWILVRRTDKRIMFKKSFVQATVAEKKFAVRQSIAKVN